MRDVSSLKPKKFQDYLTISELAKECRRDVSTLRQHERDHKIPKAHRVTVGQLEVRLWSPAQVREIKKILARMRPGRPSNG
jgi:DNA-binding transcriptional MerR regulator